MGFQSIKAWEEGETRKSGGTATFCSLHHHTTFSFKDGFGTPDLHMQRAAELDMFAVGITEHGNVTSHAQAEQAGDKYGVKALLGCELYCGGWGEEATQKKNHLTVLAETQQGYENLLRMVSRAWREGFYYQPTVSGSLLRELHGGLVVLSGCQGSLLATSLVGGKNIEEADASYARAKAVALRFKRLLGDAYYLEVQAHPELEKTKRINAGMVQISHELRIPLVATLDAHYTRPDEGHMQAILHSIGRNQTVEELEQNWGYNVPQCPLSDAEVARRLMATGLSKSDADAAIAATREISERCNVRLPQVENLRYPLPPGMDSPEQQFRLWLNEGWVKRGMKSLMHLRDQDGRNPIERVKYEMGMIIEKGFVDYFLVIADAVKFAKDSGIPVGPARGSAAASLVCYLLRITEVNPLLFPTLLFERFIDRNRHDLPDIDLDFDDELRYKVRNYLASKYGEERVGNIGTFTRFKGKNSLQDVQRAVYPDKWEVKHAVDDIKDLLITRLSGDLRADATIEDSIEQFPQVAEVFEKYPELLRALELEGNTKGMSVHAAGLVIANVPLDRFCAVYVRHDAKGKPIGEVVSLDKHDAEYLNAMKLDALGLKTMAMIRICLEKIGMTLEELYSLPLDDAETIKGFHECDVMAVFQFDGRTMQNVCAGVKPDNFMEVADVNALARPGPLHSGATGEYIDIKWGRKTATHYHPIVDEITKHTQYQVVYQEQILQIVRELGGFSWEEAARIRKIISKKRGEQEFNSMRAKFVSGAKQRGLHAADAERVFSMLATAGAYAFNAAHCVSYGLLAYWTMWLKRHYPREFYVACLTKYKDKKNRLLKKYESKIVYILRDALAHGIELGGLRVDADTDWSIDEEGVVRPGWRQVNGIGDKTAAAIMDYVEEHGPFEDWFELQRVKGIGPKTVAALENFSLLEDPFELNVLSEHLTPVRKLLQRGVFVEVDYQFHPIRLPTPTHLAAEVPYDKTDKHVEVVWAGVIRDRNPKDLFELHHSRTGEVLDPKTVKDPHLAEWVVMTGEDETDVVVITIDRWRYPEMKEQAWDITLDKDVVLVRGLKKSYQARRAIYVTDLWVLEVG
jgi:DNA polymerase-3 subunit alpha